METRIKQQPVNCILIFIITFSFLVNVKAEQNIQSYLNQNINQYEDPYEDKLFPFNTLKLNSDTFWNSIGGQSSLMLSNQLDINLHFSSIFNLHSQFGLEKIQGDSFNPIDLSINSLHSEIFKGHSLTTNELSLFFNFNKTKFYIGKITPHFGAGSERDSSVFYNSWYGISGTFLNQSYALNDKIGILLDADIFNSTYLKLKFQAALFRNDSSTLYSKPFFVNRDISGNAVPLGQSKRWAGSGTSHALSTQGFFTITPNDILSFNLAYKNQASKFDSINEIGITSAIQYNKIFANNLIVSAFYEYAEIWNSYTIKNFKETYQTLSLSSFFSGVTIGILYNSYNSTKLKRIKMLEYFLKFQVPQTNLTFAISGKRYDISSNLKSGFGLNVNYRIF